MNRKNIMICILSLSAISVVRAGDGAGNYAAAKDALFQAGSSAKRMAFSGAQYAQQALSHAASSAQVLANQTTKWAQETLVPAGTAATARAADKAVLAKEALLKAARAAKVMAHDGTEWVVEETKKHPYIAGAAGVGFGIGVVCVLNAHRPKANSPLQDLQKANLKEVKSLLDFFMKNKNLEEDAALRSSSVISCPAKEDNKLKEVWMGGPKKSHKTLLSSGQVLACIRWFQQYCRAQKNSVKEAVENEMKTILNIPADQPLSFE